MNYFGLEGLNAVSAKRLPDRRHSQVEPGGQTAKRQAVLRRRPKKLFLQVRAERYSEVVVVPLV